MQRIINIPDRCYEELDTGRFPIQEAYRLVAWIKESTLLPKEHKKRFKKIVVEYPTAELCTYPEYRGKPYFSIKYEENGEQIIGFGTYNPEVLSRYLQEYFIAPPIITADTKSEDKK